jgi:hypothetical protein
MTSSKTNNPEIAKNVSDGPDKPKLPAYGNEILMEAGDDESIVIPIRNFRGIGLNFPAMPVVTGFSVYISPTNIPLGEPGSLMALHQQIDLMVPSASFRTGFSNSFLAEHWFTQIKANNTEALDYLFQYTLS